MKPREDRVAGEFIPAGRLGRTASQVNSFLPVALAAHSLEVLLVRGEHGLIRWT